MRGAAGGAYPQGAGTRGGAVTQPALVVDTADPTPPYEQLRRQLADLIGSAVLPTGARLRIARAHPHGR